MKAILLIAVLSLTGALAARAADPLQVFLQNVDAHAKGDLPGFHATISAQFGVPQVQVRAVLAKVHDPADAFMIFQISQMSHRPPDRVLPVYRSHRKQGWGRIAQECGIKPGSNDFHRLKRGDFHYEHREHGRGHHGDAVPASPDHGDRDSDHGQGHDDDHGHDNGHGHDH